MSMMATFIFYFLIPHSIEQVERSPDLFFFLSFSYALTCAVVLLR